MGDHREDGQLRSRDFLVDSTKDRTHSHRLAESAVAQNFEIFRLETFCLFIYFYRSKKGNCVEDNDSYVFAVLLSVSFAHRVLQDIMPGKRREVGR